MANHSNYDFGYFFTVKSLFRISISLLSSIFPYKYLKNITTEILYLRMEKRLVTCLRINLVRSPGDKISETCLQNCSDKYGSFDNC